ncbi:MAG TPA: LPS export ABC transporter periplasmic protein LptC [Phenylobacterium sp.]
MSAAAHTLPEPGRRPDFLRWRRRSVLIKILRVVLPLLIGLIFATLATFVVRGTIAGAPAKTDEANAPIRLVNFRLVGRDNKGRAFVLTADSAARDAGDYQLVHLTKPALITDAESPKPTTLSSASGEFHEGNGRLRLHGGVQLNGADLAISTASSIYDTATGVLEGKGEIAGKTPLGDIQAKSYGVYDEGNRLVFKGGVRGRITK